MQQQQQPNSRNRLLPLFLLYAAFLGYWFFLAPKPQPAPEQVQSHLVAARQLEAEGRSETLARTERIEKLKKAVDRYEQYYQANKNAPDAAQARFNQINIYDYLARLEGAKSGTHWYDQAEHRLKEMEKDFGRLSGTVELEVNGQKVRETGNLAQVASERLNTIRAARDERNETKPTYRALDFFVQLTGRQPEFSYFFALLLIVVILKTLTFPFQRKQYQYQRDMMRIQPLIKEMQEKMKGRPQEEINRRMFQIYKENNVNLAAGCLPMLVLMVVLFPVFYMVRDYEYQFTKATFLWIGSEFSQRPEVWWMADNLAKFDVPLFVIYLVSTVVYSLMQPKPADPQQAQQQKMMLIMMPLMFGIFMWMGQWSSAFMLYWLILNVVSMWQSWKLNREFGLGGSGPGMGGAPVEPTPPPDEPLKPMKTVHTERPRRQRNGRRHPRPIPGGVEPRGSNKRG